MTARPKKFTSYLKNKRNQKMLAIGAGVVIVVAGFTVALSRASGFFAATEPESGTLASNATVVSDASASGGKAIQFNAPATAPGGGGTGGGNTGSTCPLPKYPDASCTGIPAGTTLSAYTGPSDITTANTVIDAKNITSCLTINAPGVIIKRSRINASGCQPDVVMNNASSKYHGGYSGTGLTISDSEISCFSGDLPTNGTAIGDNNITALRNNIYGCENGFDMDLNADIEDNYIHDLFQSIDAHTDGLQSYDGSNMKLIHNTFYGDTPLCPNAKYCAGTSAVNVNNLAANNVHTNSLTIKDNLLAGGAYTLYCPAASDTNVLLQNNHFSFKFRDPNSKVIYGPGVPAPWKPDVGPGVGAYGPSSDCGNETQSGNVYHESGNAVTLE